MQFFAKEVDRRSRHAMTAFLETHFRYDTMGSHNRSTSYSHCIKLNRLGLTSGQLAAAYEMLDADFWDEISEPIRGFTSKMGGNYTIGTNGRQGGYLVLYESRYESTEHKSWCPTCGQRNYKRVAEPLVGDAETVIGAEIHRSGGLWGDAVYLTQPAVQAIALSDEEKLGLVRKLKPALKDATLNNRCGRCGAEGEGGRVNYVQSPRHLATYPGRSIDQDVDFAEWSMAELRRRVELVTEFDAACDEIRSEFISLLGDFEPVEKVIMVPKTVTVLAPRVSA
ncbi:cysteine protease [Ralstonia pseudosolanacearum]|uniref:cysteine protease n=1 Tax=Ralstonia pseudosolanacearum TaxID=1310165 RepID=UPI003CEEE83B